MNTIVAIATPIGTGGVGVIRLSGEKSLEIVKSIFTPAKKQEFCPRKMIFGHISFSGVTDDCLVVYFPAPNSFTGEDVVEIQMHGGVKLLQETVKTLINNGAQMAQPGEFSKRAVLNGKMDITQAEGLIDMIYAESLTAMQVASNQMKGQLYNQITEMQKTITNLIASVEVLIDYPDHEEVFAEDELLKTLPKLIKNLQTLTKTEDLGQKIKNGVHVALVGNANVGKSSLLNKLVGFDRAIVTNIAGTTRDYLQESYSFKNMLFIVTDTAGIRESNDIVEKEGIKRSIQEAENCDIVVKVSDSDEILQDSNEILSLTHKNMINVLNKIDINSNKQNANFDLCVSAKTGEGIDKLKELIYEKTVDKNLMSSSVIITNIRHINLLKEVLNSLENALCEVKKVPLDIISIYLKNAYQKLGEITGETSNEKIIDTIFSKFCLGK